MNSRFVVMLDDVPEIFIPLAALAAAAFTICAAAAVIL